MPAAAGLLMILLAAGSVRGALPVLENRFVTVRVAGPALLLESRQPGGACSAKAAFRCPVKKVAWQAVRDGVWGKGRQLGLTHENGWRTDVRLYQDQPFVFIHFVAGNTTEKIVSTRLAGLLDMTLDLGVPADKLRVLGTAGLSGLDGAGSYTFSAVAEPDSRRGFVGGWLTHERGVGAFFPKLVEGRAELETRIVLGQFNVKSGETRPVDTLVLGFFDDARLGLEAYADAVARQYAIRLKPQPGVYCTWYHGGASNEAKIAANTAFAAEHLKPFGLSVMQIDDHWQAMLPAGFQHEGKIKKTGPIKVFTDSNQNYPRGMAHTAKMMDGHGMVAGIWFMPFAGNFRHPYFDRDLYATNPDGSPFHDARWSGTCLDLSNPKTQAFVAGRVKRIYDWGYRYFKLDGMHTGAPSYNIYVHKGWRDDTLPDSRLKKPAWTQVQAYRKGLEIVREQAPDTFVLGCNVSQNMISMGPAFGLIDAMRIGPDNGSAGRGNWGAVKKGAWHGSTLYFLNGRVWHNDPDPVYVRASNPINMARLMVSWVAVTGSMLTTSYQFADLPDERLDLLKRTMPGHGLLGRPVDLFETDQPRIWVLTDDRRPVRRQVIGLFNWEEKKPLDIDYALDRMGLDAKTTYVGFAFWSKQFVPPFKGRLKKVMPGASCEVLAVRPAAAHPQLISTSRHIAQCMVDVLSESWDAEKRCLSGKSRVIAGDRYELRIALPAGGKWPVKSVQLNGQDGKTDIQATHGGVRIAWTPDKTGDVSWEVRF